MKNILLLTGAMVASTLSLQGATVFTSGFDTPFAATTNGAVFLGSASTPNVVATQFFGASTDVAIVGSQLVLGSPARNRFRGAGVWLDANGWAAGLVTVGIDVTDFTAGVDSTFLFQAYSANGVDATNGVSLDLHGGSSTGAVAAIEGTGTTISTLGAQQEITGLGTAVPFTFDYNGTDQFIGLTFGLSNLNNVDGVFGSASFDNLTVDTVPEPSSAVVLGVGLVGLMLRRRR